MGKKDFLEDSLESLSLEDLERSLEDIDEGHKSSVGFNIVKKYGVLSTYKNSPLLSRVRWHGYERIDLRRWINDETPAKGITFTEEEVEIIRESAPCIEKNYLSGRVLCTYAKGKMRAKIIAHIATLSTSISNGETWNKEMNIIDWGYGTKIDFRKWTKDYIKCGKGICISFDEMKKLVELLNKS